MSIDEISVQIESTIEELTEQAEHLKEKVESTVGHASYINEKEVNKHDRYVPLDDQPYGEELIRTDGMVESINELLAELEQATAEEDLSERLKIIQSVEEDVNDLQSTFEDCFNDDFVQESKKETSDD